jgi:hypothetical protein
MKRMVAKHLARHHRFVCFTDQPTDMKNVGITAVDITDLRLKSWWGKMAIFARVWRENQRVLYFDLDTVIIKDLSRLADLTIDFGICANFTRAAGNLDWPCQYGSCVMTIGPEFNGDLFSRFWSDRHEIMARAGKFGDQKAIEELLPNAELLQPILPPHYFLGYRDLPVWQPAPPPECALVIFAGRQKPHNCNTGWVRAAWTLSQ